MKTLIQSESLELRHGSHVALKAASLSIEAGTVTALLGRNGSGKSTLLDAVLGLIPKSAGRLEVFGRDPWRKGHELRAQVGYVEADPYYEPNERVGSLMKLWRGLHPGWDDKHAARLLKAFGLQERTRIRALSRGMRTKVALLLALAQRPQLLLLDEPFDGLDCGIRDEILGEVVRHTEEGRAIVIASHDLDEVERVCDRVLVLHEGDLRFDGPLSELRARACRFVGRVAGPLQTEGLEGLASLRQFGPEYELTFFKPITVESLLDRGLEDVRQLPPLDLKEAFLAATGSGQEVAS